MTNINPASENGRALPDISDVHLKALHLHGILIAQNEINPHDLRTRNAAGALTYVAELLAEEITHDIEALMDGPRREVAA